LTKKTWELYSAAHVEEAVAFASQKEMERINDLLLQVSDKCDGMPGNRKAFEFMPFWRQACIQGIC